MSCVVEFTVNGEKHIVDERTPRETTLNAYLRYVCGLTGTKAMCHEGGCGACIVNVRARRYPKDIVETFSVNSCLVLVLSCHDWEITTIEGVGNRLNGYSEIQKRITAFAGTQCGYCTPGWVMQMYSLQDKHLTMNQIEKSFGSNTCRCTGYRPILDTMKSFAIDASPYLCRRVNDIEDLKICKKNGVKCERKRSNRSDGSNWSFISDDEVKVEQLQTLKFTKNNFFKVYKEDDIFDILDRYSVNSYMLIDGNTGKGVVETFEYPKILIDISDVKSLKCYCFDQNLVIGGNVSLEDSINIFKEATKTKNEFAYLTEFAEHFELIAHIPVRKIGSLAGNLMIKHAMPAYSSDVFLLLETVGAMVTVRNEHNQRKSLSMTDFLKYNMRGMLIVNIELPPLSSSHIFKSYKIMPRNQNSLAIVNAGFLIKWNNKTISVEDARVVFGNIGPDFVHAKDTEAYLVGKNIYENSVLQGAMNALRNEIRPNNDPRQPSPDCRKKLAIGLFYKFILWTTPTNGSAIESRFRSGGSLITREVSHGAQHYQTDPTLYPLNQPLPKLESQIQTAGEAEFANDVPALPRQVFGAFVLSTVHRGEIDTIDTKSVLETDGVLAVYTAQDFPGKNSFSFTGVFLQTEDEEILASTDIKFYGQPVAIVVAESEYLAARVAKKVEVTYRNVSSAAPVLTIDQAKKDSKRYKPSEFAIEPKSKGNNVTKVINGVYEIEAQYHYYMEPLTCVIKPVDNLLEVYDSSQYMELSQYVVANCLGIKQSDVVVRVRRIGGGFGGKISRNAQVTGACALVAHKMSVPCRFILPMQTNITIAGRRLPCQCEYEVGVDDEGVIQYLNATIVEDDGCSHNENILEYTKEGFKNCYNFDAYNLKLASVFTDLPSNSFARGPGTSEGIACIEHIMEHIAFAVNKDATEVRKANMRTEDNDLPELIDQLKKDADYEKRVKDIEQFNEDNRWMKRAIKISVMSFPVIYYGNYSAMVSIYKGDGAVTITTGGIEMGQGINTKASQVCAHELGISVDQVSVLPHYSFTAANNVFSGSSITSECVCYSIIKACGILKERLSPIREQMTDPNWGDLIRKAAEEYVELTATYMMSDKEKDLTGYTAFAVAILEAQLDVLTGRYEMLRADILEDVGLSTNPLVDVGQVEGAYIQGLGYFTCEKLSFDNESGKLLSNRSLNYHVPLARDIPIEFNVTLRYNSKNTTGVLGSKAVGEMGICTAHGITHVLRQCINESRKESGHDPKEWINIDIPYDTESILKALDVKLDEFLITK